MMNNTCIRLDQARYRLEKALEALIRLKPTDPRYAGAVAVFDAAVQPELARWRELAPLRQPKWADEEKSVDLLVATG
jgi:hypothetical protein